MTPLLAGALAAFCVTGGLLSVPLLLDRGPVAVSYTHLTLPTTPYV